MQNFAASLGLLWRLVDNKFSPPCVTALRIWTSHLDLLRSRYNWASTFRAFYFVHRFLSFSAFFHAYMLAIVANVSTKTKRGNVVQVFV